MNKFTIFSPTFHGIRESDAFGSGYYGAPRGNRLHKGVDFIANVGANISCPIEGVIHRIGICYGDTKDFTLVEIKHEDALVRVLYLTPRVKVGDVVLPGETIGYAQNISSRYGKGMTNHVHLDLRLTDGVLVGDGQPFTDDVFLNPSLFMY